jgi:ABC-type multidrug transport system fused ATPase/permease subunit
VVENGAISDMGTHEDLMQRLGTYRRLYDLQFVDVDLSRLRAGSAD